MLSARFPARASPHACTFASGNAAVSCTWARLPSTDGVPGNTGDINIASTYNKQMVELMPGGGMRLKSGEHA